MFVSMIFSSLSRPALFFASLLLLSTGCATFRGPGELRYGTGFRTPTVSLSGDRQDYHFDDRMTFDWPVDEARISRGFQLGSNRRKRLHLGLDLANRKGTPILAAQTGRVIYTGNSFRGYGKLVVLEHNEEWATLYSHLHKIIVREGDIVKQGQPIGLMGRTGRATGVHLHFEIRRNKQPVNPLAYLPLGGANRTGFAQVPREQIEQQLNSDPTKEPQR